MMSKLILSVVLMSAFLASCDSQSVLKVINKTDSARKDEVIIISREDIGQKIGLKDGYYPVFESNKVLIPSQVDDIDGDGNWDEVALILDIAENETKTLEIHQVKIAEYPVFEKRTNLRLGIKQDDGSYKEFDSYKALPCNDGFEIIAQAESVSWENDKMAFRVYFDCRNVKDLFGKLKPEMIIDKIQTPELPSYHELADWGMDILHCGSSLGSGGLALLRNDSLFRLGSTDVYEYKKIVEGPVRSVFELRYSGWNVDGEMIAATERISVYPGKYWFVSEVTIDGCKEGDQVITGIVTSKLTREPFDFQSGNFVCIGTHDKQSLNNDELGMAVLVPEKEVGKVGRTSNTNFFALGDKAVVEKNFSHAVSETYYIGQKCENNIPIKHYFLAVWGLEDDQWKTEQGFKNYIEEESKLLSSPLVIN